MLTSLDAPGTLLGPHTRSCGCQKPGRRLDLRKDLSPHSQGRGPALTRGSTSSKQHWGIPDSHKLTVIPGPRWCAEQGVMGSGLPPRRGHPGISLRCGRDGPVLLALFWVFHLLERLRLAWPWVGWQVPTDDRELCVVGRAVVKLFVLLL